MLFTLFYSFGGLDLYLGLTTPFAPKKVDAAYTGKQLRTIEYLLAGGSGGGEGAGARQRYRFVRPLFRPRGARGQHQGTHTSVDGGSARPLWSAQCYRLGGHFELRDV